MLPLLLLFVDVFVGAPLTAEAPFDARSTIACNTTYIVLPPTQSSKGQGPASLVAGSRLSAELTLESNEADVSRKFLIRLPLGIVQIQPALAKDEKKEREET